MDKKAQKIRSLVVVALLVLGVFFTLNLLWLGKILPNTKIGVFNFGGKDTDASEVMLAEVVDSYQNTNIEFLINSTEVSVPISILGIDFDKSATFAEIKENRFVSPLDAVKLIRSFFGKRNLVAKYNVNYTTLQEAIDGQFAPLEIKATNAQLVDSVLGLEIAEEKVGKVIDRSQLFSQIKQKLDNLDSQKIVVNLIDEYPQLRKEQLTRARERKLALRAQTFVFKYGQDSWSLKGDEIDDLINVDLPSTAGGFALFLNVGPGYVVKSLDSKDSENVDAQLLLNSVKADEFLAGIAKTVDRPKVDATLKFENGRIYQFTPAIDGQELDRTAVREQIGAKISTDEVANNRIVSFSLPVTVTRAKVDNEEVNALGIRELVGRGVSYFAGSIPNRAFNIQLGANRISGALVAPGEVFSFNKTVGEVSAATGYRQAYVISAGRTVLDDGGGICQVSTTVFRAALNAGLPIVSRTGHAYRVGYYEQRGFKPGLDATVFSPSVDFMFKNDTDKHILVQTVYDAPSARLEVDLYGTPDGRRVEQTEPVVSNITPAPPDKREDDPNLPKGTIKQVDFSAAGASVYFTRKVYKGNQLVIDDVFKTNYRPWQAVFLVGTKEG